MRFVMPYKGKFISVIVLTIILGILAPTRPILIQYTLDNDVAVGDYQGMVSMMIILFGLLIFHSIAQYIHTYLSGWLGQQVIRDIRSKHYPRIIGRRLKLLVM